MRSSVTSASFMSPLSKNTHQNGYHLDAPYEGQKTARVDKKNKMDMQFQKNRPKPLVV